MAKAIIVLDLGSTTARALVISSESFDILGSAKYEIKLIQSSNGSCEINPNELFTSILKVLRDALRDSQVDIENVLCLAISVQRASFIVIDKVTGEPYVQIISWSDRRANQIVERTNKTLIIRGIRSVANVLYWVTHKNRFKHASNFKVHNEFVAPRLSHLLQNNRKLRDAMRAGRAALCTLDTWLLNRLKNFDKFEKFDFITDISNLSSTGLFDPFKLEYITMNMKYFGIDESMLARIVDNSYDYGYTHKAIFGMPIRIAAIIGDQAASLIGNACFRRMDAKITLGTGTFLTINTGRKCMGSRNGAHPTVAWNTQTRSKRTTMVFCSERNFGDSSKLIRFAKTIGLCAEVEELSELASSVSDSGGIMFIPKFHLMAGFIGFKQSTTRSHVVRALLEAIVFQVAHFFFLTKEDTNYHFDRIRIDGGISANNFICQSIADLLNIQVERGFNSIEITSIGCAYLAAYNCGILDELEHATKFYRVEKTFVPNESNRKELFMRYKRYVDVNNRFDKLLL